MGGEPRTVRRVQGAGAEAGCAVLLGALPVEGVEGEAMGQQLKVCSRDGWTSWNEDGSTMPFGKHEGEAIDEIPTDYLVWILLVLAPEFEGDDNGLFDEVEEVLNARGFERKSGPRKTKAGNVVEHEW